MLSCLEKNMMKQKGRELGGNTCLHPFAKVSVLLHLLSVSCYIYYMCPATSTMFIHYTSTMFIHYREILFLELLYLPSTTPLPSSCEEVLKIANCIGLPCAGIAPSPPARGCVPLPPLLPLYILYIYYIYIYIHMHSHTHTHTHTQHT